MVKAFKREFERAKERQSFVRTMAFMSDDDLLCDIIIAPLTLRKIAMLTALDCSFVNGGKITTQDCVSLVWVLDKDFCTTSHPDYLKRYGQCLDKWSVWIIRRRKKFIDLVNIFLDESYQDFGVLKLEGCEESEDSNPLVVTEFSFFDRVVFKIAEKFGWSEEEILNKPIKRVGLYYKRLMRMHDSNYEALQPTDLIKFKYQQLIDG